MKTTVNDASIGVDDKVSFHMSNKQYRYAQNHDESTVLVFVTGIETSNPSHLVMRFDNPWLNGSNYQ